MKIDHIYIIWDRNSLKRIKSPSKKTFYNKDVKDGGDLIKLYKGKIKNYLIMTDNY